MAEGGQTRVVALLQITLRSGIDHLHVRCSGYGVPVTRYSALMFDGEGFHLSRTCCMPRRKRFHEMDFCTVSARLFLENMLPSHQKLSRGSLVSNWGKV